MVAGTTGVLLNNEIDDFAIKPNEPNAYGLIGNEENSIEPKKRPLSSMSPFIVSKNNEVLMAGGSPGGSRIITTCLQIILNVIEHKMNIAEAIIAPRIHHQLYPEEIRIEKGISVDTVRILKNMNHQVMIKKAMGEVNAIMVTEDGINGYSDPRGYGLTVGY